MTQPFIEGLRPVLDDENEDVRYRIESGVFKQFCRRAELDPANKYVFLIDEINRANIAKVFGELITLIEDDKRLTAENETRVALPYSKTWFGVPSKVLILGTMNTADRSNALLDMALRRRFAFLEVMPAPNLLGSVTLDNVSLNLGRLLAAINASIRQLMDKDHQIGHSYLMNVSDIDSLSFAWYHRVIPLLEEYFYNDGARLVEALGGDFVKLIDDGGTNGLPSGVSAYEVKSLTDQNLMAALEKLST